VGVAVAVAVMLGVEQLDASATAAPTSGAVSAANASEANWVAAPIARLASPTRCNFSQLTCRDRRKVVPVPLVVSQVRRALHQRLVSRMAT
jgi:hypothetical protein